MNRLTLADEDVEHTRRTRNRTREDRRNARGLEDLQDLPEVLLGDLENRAGLLVEEDLQRIAVRQLRDNAAAARDRHFGERGDKTAVGTVVVRERELITDDLLHRIEETLERRRIGVGMRIAELTVDLRQRRGAQRHLAIAEIDVDEERALVLGIGLEIRRQRETDVLHRRKARDDERQGRDLLLLLALRILPRRVH